MMGLMGHVNSLEVCESLAWWSKSSQESKTKSEENLSYYSVIVIFLPHMAKKAPRSASSSKTVEKFKGKIKTWNESLESQAQTLEESTLETKNRRLALIDGKVMVCCALAPFLSTTCMFFTMAAQCPQNFFSNLTGTSKKDSRVQEPLKGSQRCHTS